MNPAGSAARRSSGTIKQLPGSLVMLDASGLGIVAYSPGQSRGVQVPITPSVMQRFQVLGFSTQIRMAAVITTLASVPSLWSRFGNLWAGVYANSPLPNTEAGYSPNLGAQFPPDLSTFTKIWDGAEDDIATVNSNTRGDITNYHQIAANYMLPAPVEIAPSSQLGFGLILTRSLFHPSVQLLVAECNFTVLYSTDDVNYGP